MRKAARVIVLHDDKLLVMHRNKFGQEYDTLPGGNVEIQETPEAAAFREIKEETSIEIKDLRLVFIEEAGDPYGTQYIYLGEYVAGEPQLSPGSEEEMINKLGSNLYEPKWLPLTQLPDSPFLSERLKQCILRALTDGFPDEAIEIR